MKAEQLSIFLENSVGRLLEVAEALAGKNINIRALSLADTVDYGVLRLIADRPEEARQALRERGFTSRVIEVLAVEVPDRPGSLARILSLFAGAGINVEYMYAAVGITGQGAVMIFRVDDLDKGIGLITHDVGRVLSQADFS